MRTHQVALGQTACLVPDLLFTPECALALNYILSVGQVLNLMGGLSLLVAQLLYGAGLRVSEALQ